MSMVWRKSVDTNHNVEVIAVASLSGGAPHSAGSTSKSQRKMMGSNHRALRRSTGIQSPLPTLGGIFLGGRRRS